MARSSGSTLRRKFSLGMKGSQSIANGGCPLIEPGRDERAGLGGCFGELANERGQCAAPPLPWCASRR